MKGLPKHILDVVKLTPSRLEGEDPKLTVVHEYKPCEDCGLVIKNRRIDARLQKDFAPNNQVSDRASIPKHWSLTCRNCNMKRNLDTGKYDIPVNKYRSYLKERNCKTDK